MDTITVTASDQGSYSYEAKDLAVHVSESRVLTITINGGRQVVFNADDWKRYDHDSDEKTKLLTFLNGFETVAAIKEYRNRTGCTLKAAKEVLDPYTRDGAVRYPS